MFKDFNPIQTFFTKNNPQDLRLGDFAKSLTEIADLKDSTVLIGYPDDEGIKNNNGRVGAKEAPKMIRDYLYKMTPHLLKEKDPKIYDLADLKIEGSLTQRHETVKKHLNDILKKSKVITIGGGNDYSFPDGSAFLETFTDKPLIINFDAHLDVRPTKNDIPTSGTPFYQLLNKYKNFDFLEIGIQSQCNSKYHYEWALEKQTKILTYDEILYSGKNQHTKILEFLEPFMLKKRACYISIDIDGFSNAFAPGCSQSFATGFDPNSFLTVLKVLNDRLDVKLLGIYEVSPPLDQDNKTSKLAAQLIFESL